VIKLCIECLCWHRLVFLCKTSHPAIFGRELYYHENGDEHVVSNFLSHVTSIVSNSYVNEIRLVHVHLTRLPSDFGLKRSAKTLLVLKIKFLFGS